VKNLPSENVDCHLSSSGSQAKMLAL